MAIILSGTAPVGLDALVVGQARPVFLVEDDWINFGDQPEWDSLQGAQHVLSRAIRTVGRIETEDRSIPFIGTAFAVAPDLVMTADFVGKVLAGENGKMHAPAWINFKAEHGVIEQARVPVVEVLAQSPLSGISLLRLGDDLAPDRVAALSMKFPGTLTGAEICVVGYSSNDVRNDPDTVEELFGSVFNVKRLSPGKVIEVDYSTKDGAARTQLLHDATTLGGASGSPLIEVETGEVVGLHYAGQYRVSNYALSITSLEEDPALDEFADLLDLDFGPKTVAPSPSPPIPAVLTTVTKTVADSPPAMPTTNLSGGLDLPRAIVGAPPEQDTAPVSERRTIFGIDGLLAVNRDLVAAGHNTDDALATLFSFFAPEFVGAIPVRGDTPIKKLHSRLSYLNRYLSLYGQNTPFYTVLKTAVAMTGIPDHRKKIDGHLAVVIAFEEELMAAS